MPTSGYTHCACRDCFETLVSNDMANPDMCDDCEAHQCEPDSECSRPPTLPCTACDGSGLVRLPEAAGGGQIDCFTCDGQGC